MSLKDQLDGMDLISIASYVIGLQNLQENREQSAQNDIQSANDKQAKYLLEELKAMFETQNKMLKEIVSRLDRLELNLYRSSGLR